MTEPPHLFQFRVSHYNEKVRWALDYKGWPHVRHTMVPGFHILGARLRSGQSQLPVLVIGDETLSNSSHILAEIERRQPAPPLYPSHASDLERAREIERFFDDEVAPDLRRLFWSTYLDHSADCTRMATDGSSPLARGLFRALLPVMRPLFRSNMGVRKEQIERARSRLGSYFDRLESEIGPSGYLVGDRFGIADLAAAAVMTAIIRPPQFSYPLPEPWPAALVELRDNVADRRGFSWVLDMYARHRGASAEIVP